MADPTRVALIGYGLAGRSFHRPLIGATDELVITHVVTGNPGRREHAARELPSGSLVGGTAQLWEQADDYDAVVVAVENDAHADLASAAIRLGKQVVVDKPMTVTAAQAESLVGQARTAGVVLTAFHNRRWDSDTLTLRRLLGADALGAVTHFESRFERFRPELSSRRPELPAEQGGGVLLDLGTHLLDQALHLFGPATTVYAEIGTRRDRALADDDCFLALTHASGVRSHLWCSLMAPVSGPRMVVEGVRGGYRKDQLDGQEDALRAGWDPRTGPWGGEPAGVLVDTTGARPVPSEPGAWVEFYRGFASAVRDGGPPPVPPEDAVAVLRILEAARLSARDATVVPL
jgi:predicted dehydrogenase